MFIKIATLTISERLDNCQILRTLLQNMFHREGNCSEFGKVIYVAESRGSINNISGHGFQEGGKKEFRIGSGRIGY